MSGITDDGWINLSAQWSVFPGLVGGGVSLILAAFYAYQIYSIEVDRNRYPHTAAIADRIHEGAKAFLKSEYLALAFFVAAVAGFLGGFLGWEDAVCFLTGALLSASCGYLGMTIATKANVRTTIACAEGTLNDGLKVAFKSGSVMALATVGAGLGGVSVMYLIFNAEDKTQSWENLAAFAFGGSCIALFARVGGGIYTKAADVGADLVGKYENNLNEDSPDNPATIADNVGDNVGDVAGMGADLFESFVGSIIAAATLGYDEFSVVGNDNYEYRGVALPFWVAGLGAFCAIIGTLMIRTSYDPTAENQHQSEEEKNNAALESLLGSIRLGIYGASVLVCGTSVIACGVTFGLDDRLGWELYACILFGLACGILIGYFTEYATSYTYWPTVGIARKGETGAAPVVIQGLGVGMLSTVPPMLFIVATILGSYYIARPHGFYGVSIAAVGMLSTLGVTLATDAFGPVADNAGGIAEMTSDAGITDECREKTDSLDALGNTTAATGKGFAIGSAVLTALALLNAFAVEFGFPKVGNEQIPAVNLMEPVVLPGILLGALLPFVFAALTMLSVGNAAEAIIWEGRRQMNDKWILEAHAAQVGATNYQWIADHNQCVHICTVYSLKEMIIPGVIAIFSPIVVGFSMGGNGILGLLAGAISAGSMLAVMMANAGGAWDNAKKYVEKQPGPNGKGSDMHKATVVGDTIGDPFKDTSGPALNILIKLMSVVSLVMAPKMGNTEDWWKVWIAGIILAGAIILLVAIMFLLGDKLDPFNDEEKAEIARLADDRKHGRRPPSIQEAGLVFDPNAGHQNFGGDLKQQQPIGGTTVQMAPIGHMPTLDSPRSSSPPPAIVNSQPVYQQPQAAQAYRAQQPTFQQQPPVQQQPVRQMASPRGIGPRAGSQRTFSGALPPVRQTNTNPNNLVIR